MMRFTPRGKRRAAVAFAALALLGSAGTARAYLPLPPFQFVPNDPPRGVNPEPPIIVELPPDPPEVIPPPPVRNTPEPGTLLLGAIGAGVAGFVARRKKK